MNYVLQNLVGCYLMTWKVNPSKRNTNNIITINVKENQEVSVGDFIAGQYSDTMKSFYLVTEILNRRKSALKGFDYLMLKVKWQNKKPNMISFNKITNKSFDKFYNV